MDGARLQREIDLRKHLAALKIPDANRLVEIRDCDARPAGIQRDQRRRAGNVEAALHLPGLQGPEFQSCISIAAAFGEQVKAVPGEPGVRTRSPDLHRTNSVARRGVPDIHRLHGRRHQAARPVIESDDCFTLTQCYRTNRFCERKIPHARAVTPERTRHRVPSLGTDPDAVGIPLGRIRDVQAALEILDQALRIQCEVPADKVPGDAKFLVANREAPGTVHRFADQFLQLARRNADRLAARGALHAWLDFHRTTGRGDDLDAQIRQARMTDTERQAHPADIAFTVDDHPAHEGRNLERRYRPFAGRLQPLRRQRPLPDLRALGGCQQPVLGVEYHARGLLRRQAGYQHRIIVPQQHRSSMTPLRRGQDQ